jgi:hypothetical protein
MVKVIKSQNRGFADHGWLKSYHTFSFADYYDPKRMGFSVLRVINEDWIEGARGFDPHPHRDMEIITYVVEGELAHKDSMGTSTVIKPGEIQRMSAGTGIRHSEYNQSSHQKCHLLQIWILPEISGVVPSYEQKSFEEKLSAGELVLVGSKNGKNGSITINQDVDLYVCKAISDGEHHLKTYAHRHLWLQIVKGQVLVEETILESGDGVELEKIESMSITWTKGAEFLLFDLP